MVEKITLTENTVISLLKASIGERKIPDEIKESITPDSLAEVFEFADKHDVAQIVGDVLFKNKLMPDCEAAEAFRKCLLFSLMNYRCQALELESICNAFEEHNIAHLPLKGAVIRELYPEPWLRTGCDVDILIKQEDLEKASEIIVCTLNGENTFRGSHDWGFKTENGTYVELHFRLIEDYGKKGISTHSWLANCLENVWQYTERAEGKQYRFKMNDDVFYFYHIAHMAKHIENGGCGIRPFADLWLLNNRVDFNKEKRNSLLQAEKLDKFEKAVVNLSEAWFSGAEKDSLSELVEKYVFTGGVYGSKENSVAVQQNKTGGKAGYVFSRIFLPYNFLKVQYPVIEKHKYLTPVFQGVRWFERLVLHKRMSGVVKEYKINKNMSGQEQEAISDLLIRLGL